MINQTVLHVDRNKQSEIVFAVSVRSKVASICESRTNKLDGRLHAINFLAVLLMYCCHC